MKNTPLLLTPSLEEIQLQAAKMGLPQIEAEKFYHFYESKGWIIGKTKMKSFVSALAGWKLRWQERIQIARASVPESIASQNRRQAIREANRLCE